MSFDDDLRRRFTTNSLAVDELDSGAQAAGSASARRALLRRVGGAGALVAILLAGFLAIASIGDDQASDLRTADPDVEDPQISEDPIQVPTTVPEEPTPVPDGSEGTAIVTVDVDGVVRLNGVVVDPDGWEARLRAMTNIPSEGPEGQVLATSVGTSDEAAGCPRFTILDALGQPVDEHPLHTLSRCLPGEMAEWSSAGHVVLVSPTQEDAWSITVLAADGRSAQLTSPGAFQPQQLDVHTDANGRTQALVLGTGEELVYVDVDAFLEEEVPSIAIRGMQNETNLVLARFVDGFEQHPFQAQVDEVISNAIFHPPTRVEPHASVFDVNNVQADDTLNARSGPGVESDVVFEFGPNATGVVRTGNDATSTDGATWFEVFAPTSGTEFDVGWVNSAFLIEAPVPDTRPCLFNGPQDHYIGIDWTNPEGSASSEAAVISNIETYRFGGCLRTVIEFSDAWSYEDGGARRVTSLPTDIVVTRDTPPIGDIATVVTPTIDFGRSITGAEVADARFQEAGGESQSTFVSMDDNRQLEGVIYGPTTTMTTTFDNSNGTLVIDIADIRLPADADPAAINRVGPKVSPLFDDAGVVLTGLASSSDETRWTFTGLARPFEATMGVQVRSTSGSSIDVEWIGGVVEGARADNGVMTTTWSEAWGQFDFTITLPDDVDPSTVLVDFDPSGGAADDPQVVVFALADFARN